MIVAEKTSENLIFIFLVPSVTYNKIFADDWSSKNALVTS